MVILKMEGGRLGKGAVWKCWIVMFLSFELITVREILRI